MQAKIMQIQSNQGQKLSKKIMIFLLYMKISIYENVLI